MKWNMKEQLSVYLVMGLQGSQGKDPVDLAREALEGGVTMLQLREKQASALEILRVGSQIRTLCHDFNVPFIVNDRVDIAIVLEADGVHVGQDDIPGDQVRTLLGADKIVGLSAGSMEEAERAMGWEPDYLGVGAVYATSSKKDAGAPIGTGLIEQILQHWSVPIVGIGGIDATNAAAVYKAGADGVAVVSAITQAKDPCQAAALLRSHKIG